MARYDARLCLNSAMTSFAGSKSWNFCGRSGVNSATACRNAAGSNEVIGRNDLDANREMDRRKDGHGDAPTRKMICQSAFTDSPRIRRVRGCGQGETAGYLRTF